MLHLSLKPTDGCDRCKAEDEETYFFEDLAVRSLHRAIFVNLFIYLFIHLLHHLAFPETWKTTIDSIRGCWLSLKAVTPEGTQRRGRGWDREVRVGFLEEESIRWGEWPGHSGSCREAEGSGAALGLEKA